MPLPNQMITKRALNKVGDYSLVNQFKGYRAREDKTMLDPSVLISPSQNVVLNTAGRVALVKGYELDGAASATADSGILSNFDFTNFKGDVRNMRAGFLTTAGNDGKLQYRYITGTNTINWIDLKTGLTNVNLSFTDWWDASTLTRLCLWVDGGANIYSWNGAVTTFASATVTTLTKQGTKTWGEEGFSATGSIVIGGVTATYTGGSGTTTLTGVSVDFSATIISSIIHQSVITTSSFTGMPLTKLTLIGCGKSNHVYLGSSNNSVFYVSKVSTFSDYSFSSPRLAGEGFNYVLHAPPVKFIAQEGQSSDNDYDMYISEGANNWSISRFTSQISYNSSGVPQATIETPSVLPIKIGPYLGAMSEKLVTKMKNHIVFMSRDKVINFFGYMSFQYVPMITDFSFPIIDDMNNYDITDASIFYHKNYIYVAVPKAGLIRIYNMTNQTKQQTGTARAVESVDPEEQPWFWEAPVTYPISGFYVVDGELYGHSYTTSESYKLFTGGSLNGQQIEANATFAYDDKGDRTQSKGSNELWVEGYIKQNTILNATINKDLGAFATNQTVTIDGSDTSIVAFGGGGNTLGDSPLGVQTLGNASITVSQTNLPAWFHVAKTYISQPSYYLEGISFNTKGVDLDWQIIAYGTNAEFTNEGNNQITQ